MSIFKHGITPSSCQAEGRLERKPVIIDSSVTLVFECPICHHHWRHSYSLESIGEAEAEAERNEKCSRCLEKEATDA